MSKTHKKTEFDIPLPSLALSALVFLLAIFAGSGSMNRPNTVVVSANETKYLSEQDDIESLQNDLLLLQADNLDEEVAVLNQIK